MSRGPLTRDDLQSAQGGVWAYVSPSRLNCWLSCPLKFRFRYVDGLHAPATASLFLGKAVHRALETFYRHRQLGITLAAADLSRRLAESWGPMAADEGATFQSAAEEEALRRQATELVTAYLGGLPAGEPRPLAVEAAVEAPLVDPASGEDLGLPLVGIMDLVLGGTDGPVIADFKTSIRSGEPLEVTHEVQLSSYAYLFRNACGQRESALEIRSLIKTKVPRVEFHRYPARTEAHFRRLFCVIRAYLDALDVGRFTFRPGWTCACCDFRDGPCRSWQG